MESLLEKGDSAVVRLETLGEVAALLQLLEEIAAEQQWHPGDQLRAYLNTSHHLAVRVAGELAGGLQIVLPDATGHLPCQVVWPEVAMAETAQVAHVTILALCPEYRGRFGLFWPLCVELWRYCVSVGIAAIVMEATPPMLQLYRRIGFPLEVIGDLRKHWGEDCYLCRLGMLEVAGTLLMKAMHSAKYRQLVSQAYRADPLSSCMFARSLP